MAWRKNDPNLTNDPAYLEPKVTKLTEDLAEKAAKERINDLVVNVKDYGAKGDGLTDDTTSILNAIASLGVNGGVVYFPKGTYVVSNTLGDLKQKIKIKGASRGASILSYSNTTDYLFRIANTAGASTGNVLNVVIEDLTIKGNGIAKGIEISNAFKNVIQNVHFDRCTTAFHYTNNAGDNTLLNVIFTDNAIGVKANAQVNFVSHCVFAGNQLSIQVGEQNVATFAGIKVSNTTFVSNFNNVYPQNAVKVWNGSGANNFTNCWFEGFLTTVEVGDEGATTPAYSFSMKDCRVAATSKCIHLKAGNRFSFDNVTFAPDNSVNQPSPYTNSVPTEMVIESAAESGIISNPVSIISGRSFDPTLQGLPKAGWVVLNNRLKASQFSNGIDLVKSNITNINKFQGRTDALFDITAGSGQILRLQRDSTGEVQFVFGDSTVDHTLKNGGHIEINGYMRLGSITAATAINNSFFVEAGVLKFKDNAGVVKTVNLT